MSKMMEAIFGETLATTKMMVIRRGDSGYLFPAFHEVPHDNEDRMDQLSHISGEISEAFEALYAGDEFAYIMEMLDAYHAIETSLREFTPELINAAAVAVEHKNRIRGYYEPVEEDSKNVWDEDYCDGDCAYCECGGDCSCSTCS